MSLNGPLHGSGTEVPRRILPVALTVAGSDSSAGAGIQADLKTFSALGVYGVSVVTALTAQNTVAVTAIHAVPPDFIRAQMEAVVSDLPPAATKTGMLPGRAAIETVAAEIQRFGLHNVVVDPVMVASSGRRLMDEGALDALRSSLLPFAAVVTPNLPEAEVLSGCPISSPDDVREAARRIWALGAKAVIVKGGHRAGQPVDVLYDGSKFYEFDGPRIPSRNTHGTGCTYSAAIAAFLARGWNLVDAARLAKAYVAEAIRSGLSVGQGAGPTDHFFYLRSPDGPAWLDRLGVRESRG